MIHIIVENQEIRLYSDPDVIADGSVAFSTLHFEFTPEWAGYVKVARFVHSGVTTHVVIDNDNNCSFPAGVSHGLVYLSVWGQAPGLSPRGTTNQLQIRVYPSGASSEDIFPPTSDLYAQLLQDIVDHSRISSEFADAAAQSASEALGHAEQTQQDLSLVDTLHDETKIFRDDAEDFAQAAHGSEQTASEKASQAESAMGVAVAAAGEAGRYYASLIGTELVVDVINGTLNLYSAGDYSPIDIELNDRSLEVWGA